ncbi:MAG: glycosyltransferase family 39 protein, partial [Candidatus Undinarchaeales archaeon]
MKRIIESIKKNPAPFILLILIALTGIYLRSYHADYPVIGYHNWKETHYLTEARNFAEGGFFEHGFFVPERDYPKLDAAPSGVHEDTFPTTSILTALLFKISGPSLTAARALMVLFSAASIFAMYFFVKQLFKREDIALVSAALMAINPLFVFFGRNVQLIGPALFFMLSGGYFYLKWRDSKERNDFIFAATFIALAGLTKYTFLAILLPIILTFEYKKDLKRILKKAYWPAYAVFLSLPLWFVYSSLIGEKAGQKLPLLNQLGLSSMSSVSWWTSMKSFTLDNYSLLGLLFALLGLLLVGY